jgi:hypothetical protein
MANKTIEWLLAAEDWIAYRTHLDLLDRPEDDPQVRAARKSMLADPKIQALVDEMEKWPGTVLNSHKSASQPFHKLAFIADLGLNVDDPPVKQIVKRIMNHQSSEGPFQLPMNIAVQYGGSGKDGWAWALCDAPVIVYALIKMGLSDHPAVQKAVQYLDGLVRANGWPCVVSPELGKFRGPGRKDDLCPYATLVMLKVLSLVPELCQSQSAKIGVENLLALWDQSKEKHPYMFFMGTDFRKLKAPMFWYDIVHVIEVLSQFKWTKSDKRFKQMLKTVKEKANRDGQYVPESIWTAWKDWDFGQKKNPSRGLTLYIERAMQRVN